MKEFIEFILQFGNLNEQQIGLISKKSQVVELEKGDFFWEAGKSIKHVGFTIKGILRVYYYNNQSEEITRYFIDENLLILYGPHIESNYIPSEYLQAIEKSELVVFSKKESFYFYESLQSLFVFIFDIIELNKVKKAIFIST